MRCYRMKLNETQTIYYRRVDTKHWSIYVAATNKGLCYIGSANGGMEEMCNWIEKNRPNAKLIEDWNQVSAYADQLIAYLNEKRKHFDLPLDLAGTVFQEAVWTALRNIPFGETQTYTNIAENIDKPKSIRAVGTAIGANPVLMVVPCHRVISKRGGMAGYRGGIPMKEKLLKLENSEAAEDFTS